MCVCVCVTIVFMETTGADATDESSSDEEDENASSVDLIHTLYEHQQLIEGKTKELLALQTEHEKLVLAVHKRVSKGCNDEFVDLSRRYHVAPLKRAKIVSVQMISDLQTEIQELRSRLAPTHSTMELHPQKPEPKLKSPYQASQRPLQWKLDKKKMEHKYREEMFQWCMSERDRLQALLQADFL